MSNTELVEDAIVARLKSREAFEGMKVGSFPNVPSRYAFGAAGEELIVGYERSQYAGAESMHPQAQQRAAEFIVTVIARSLRGPKGTAAIIDECRKALFGWKPTHAQSGAALGYTPMVMTKDEFVGEDQGIWRFALFFQSTTTIVAEAQAEDGPSIALVTVNPAPGTPGEGFSYVPPES